MSDELFVPEDFAAPAELREMSLNDNLRDLERHARDFTERRGFT